MHYQYVTFMTPAGGGTIFWRGPHILMPEALAHFQQDVATKMALASKGALIPAGAVLITFLYDLPEEVARARWPQDFEPAPVPP